jgi:hypothetical protein
MAKNRVLVLALVFICSCGSFAALLRGEAEKDGRQWQRLLAGPTEKDWDRAAEMVTEERRASIAELMRVASSPKTDNEPFYGSSARNTAIALIGQLRAPEAVPALAQLLSAKAGQSVLRDGLSSLSPAGKALVDIGMPAVPAVLDILAAVGVSSEDKGTYVHGERPGVGETWRVGPPLEKSSPLGDQCLRIVVRIKGLEETEAGLRRWIAAEPDARRRKNLQDALEALSRPALRKGFEIMQAQRESQERTDWAGWTRQEQEKKAQQQAVEPQPAQPGPEPSAK